MAAHVDFETFSKADLPSVGAFRYAEDASTEALILSYSLGDNQAPVVVDLTKNSEAERRKLEPLFDAVRSGQELCAHNSQFERVIWEKVCATRQGFPVTPKSSQWDCTAARAAAISIPRSLEGAGAALKLKSIKDPHGKALINLFAKPQRKGDRVRPADRPDEWRRFMEYCQQDVVVEQELDRILPKLNHTERRVFRVDYKVNDLGIPIDVPLIHKALDFIDETSKRLVKQAKEITGVKPSQRDRLLEWLQEEGTGMATLQAAEVERVLKRKTLDPKVRQILEARLEISRAGTKKIQTMLDCKSADDRVRGAFWFHSATTGRWGSDRVQFHNMAKPSEVYPQEDVISLLESDGLDLMYDRPLSAIAYAVRGFIKAPEGREFLIADYNAIEPRGLAWLVDEDFLLDQYKTGRDPYKAVASRLFHVRYEDVTDAQRFFGKQTVLGANYNMGAKKFMMTCAKYGVLISEEEADEMIKAYRKTVPKIVQFWKDVERAALKAVLTGKPVTLAKGRITFMMQTLKSGFDVLFCILPSGRRMTYPQPRIENIEKFGKLMPTLVFKTSHHRMWVDEETYGGKITENIIQAMCRDNLADGMVSCESAGLPVLLHVHDEIGCEVDAGKGDVEAFEQIVCRPREWASTIPMKAEGKRLKRYAK